MLRCSLLCLSLLLSQVTHGAPIDEFRISDMERQIGDLQTAVREQARQLAQLQQSGGRTVSTQPTSAPPTSTSNEARWLNYSRWQQLKTGMTELQVIELLGTPTQLRNSDDGQSRQLLYAMEIGRSGFLTGKVTMTQGKLTAMETPVLR